MIARAKRRCTFEHGPHHPHCWERVNANLEPFRRGRIVFFCDGKREP